MIAFMLAALAVQTDGPAQPPPSFTPEQRREIQRRLAIAGLTNEQALIVYDQCLSREAAALSRTELAEDAIFGQASRRCLALKAQLLTGAPPERFIQFKRLDEVKAAAFPALTRKVRERRKAYESEIDGFGPGTAPAAGEHSQVVERDVPTGRFEIPDELVPAIVPYMQCLNASAGIPMYRGNREALIPPPPGITKGSDCSAMRKQAAERGDALLKAYGHRDAAERRTLVERTLSQADAFVPRAHVPPQPQPQN
jgi:hypothetical protein